MTVYDWAQQEDWTEQKVAMPVVRPKGVDSYLEALTGPNEQHRADPESHCTNPKCGYRFNDQDRQEIEANGGEFKCPHCGYEDNYLADNKSHIPDPDGSGKAILNPGGRTRSGLTLEQMGQIGEAVVLGLGELQGIGSIQPASSSYNFPIDAIITGQKGNFGVEIKANHSEAQERFKIGGAKERAAKIAYCMQNGLKPALVGVRLNFFTDKAYVFFREGLTDTWISNKQMIHVGTFDFSHLNPFKSPDPQAQAMAVDNANLQDQSMSDQDSWSDIDDVFGPALSKVSFDEDEHKRDEEGKFTFKEDVHELKVHDEKGKHRHTVKRCPHCGVSYAKPAEHKGRIECPSCGEDPERNLKSVSRIVVGAVGENNLAQGLGWDFHRYSGNGKPVYKWTDPSGYNHIVTGYGDHGKANIELAHQQTGRRMQACMNGSCLHQNVPEQVTPLEEPGAPVFSKGQQVQVPGGGLGIVLGADGEHILVKSYQSGKTERVPAQNLRAAAEEGEEKDPDYSYLYYMSELVVKEWDHNLKTVEMLKELLDEFGVDAGNTLADLDATKVDTGEIRTRGDEITIKHTQLSEPEVREHAEEAIKDWWRKHQNEDWEEPSEWQSLSK